MNEKQNQIKKIWNELTKDQKSKLLIEIIKDEDLSIGNESYDEMEKRGNTVNFGPLGVCPLCKK
ncbi:hypothetical protein [Providencia manganoxydans]|uniref:hypothetical protein n=1 Tax=Providencia manganoxydans TaxID=2923283 RepID=UPI0032D9E5D2